MKSQDQLNGLVEQSMAGISECRKRFQDLGDNPGPMDVRTVLDVATRVQLIHLCSAELESVLEVLKRVVWGPAALTQAKPYVQSFKKHMRTAQGLNLNRISTSCVFW